MGRHESIWLQYGVRAAYVLVVTDACRFETIGPFSRAGLGYGPVHGLVARRYGFALSLTTVDNDENLLSILKKHLASDPRLTVECADGDDFLRSAQARDLISFSPIPGPVNTAYSKRRLNY
jgi:hypothetical protein